MPYKDKKKQKEYMRNWKIKNRDHYKQYQTEWHKTHKDYKIEWYKTHKDYNNDYMHNYLQNDINNNKLKLIKKKEYDKIRLDYEKQNIVNNIRRRQNPMDYKDYYTEDEYFY